MKIGKCEMPDTGNKITTMAETPSGKEVPVLLPAEDLAQSAFEHNIDLGSFKATLDKLSSKSKSSTIQIIAWREEATNRFFELLKQAGKLRPAASEFLGSSDFSENEDDPSNSNINIKN